MATLKLDLENGIDRHVWTGRRKSVQTHHLSKLEKSLANRRRKFLDRVTTWESLLRSYQPKFRQVQHLNEKVGGLLNFSLMLSVHPLQILGWCTPELVIRVPHPNSLKHFKCNPLYTGLMPQRYLGKMVLSARTYGIFLTPYDLLPDLITAGGDIKNNEGELQSWLELVKTSQLAKEFQSALVEFL